MLSRWVTDLVRAWVSLVPLLGLIPKPEARPNGISALVRVKGDEEWIEPCLLSICEFADEILLLDNGASPATQLILERLQASLGELTRVEQCPYLDLFHLSNLGLERARFRWVIRWDADFVAHTSGTADIQNLRHYLLELDPRRYYAVYLAAAEVAGDLFHQFPDLRVRFDGQVHTASRWVRYVPVRRALNLSAASPHRVLRKEPVLRVTHESLRLPKFYRVLRWKEVTYFHINVKSARHTLMRHFWLEWLDQGDFRAFPTLEAYTLAQIHDRWGVSDLDEASERFMALYCCHLVPFNPESCGPYPELLRPFLARPGYRVRYRDGQIVGRAEAARNAKIWPSIER